MYIQASEDKRIDKHLVLVESTFSKSARMKTHVGGQWSRGVGPGGTVSLVSMYYNT